MQVLAEDCQALADAPLIEEGLLGLPGFIVSGGLLAELAHCLKISSGLADGFDGHNLNHCSPPCQTGQCLALAMHLQPLPWWQRRSAQLQAGAPVMV